MRKITLTGATSMLGLALIEESLRQGTKVVAIIRNDSPRRSLLPENQLLTVHACPLDQLPRLDLPEAAGSEAFYHFAWAGSTAGQRNDAARQAGNIATTLEALKLAARLGCRRFIGAGSQAEYGRKDEKIFEDSAVNPDSAYGVAKYAAGHLALTMAETLDITCVWTRIFSVYGPHDHLSTMVMYCIDMLLKGQKPLLTTGEQLWDYLFSADAARAFYLLGQKADKNAVYNLASGRPVVLRRVAETIRDQIDPALPLGFGEKPRAAGRTRHLQADITALRAATGFAPAVSLEEGMEKTIKYCKALGL